MGRRVVSAVCIALVTALLQAAPQQAAAEDRDYLVLGVGWFDVIFHDNVATSARLEYRSGYDLLWTIKPFVGVMGTTDEAYYGYGGFYIDFALAELFPETPVVNRIVVNGNAAVGYYEEGDGQGPRQLARVPHRRRDRLPVRKPHAPRRRLLPHLQRRQRQRQPRHRDPQRLLRPAARRVVKVRRPGHAGWRPRGAVL